MLHFSSNHILSFSVRLIILAVDDGLFYSYPLHVSRVHIQKLPCISPFIPKHDRQSNHISYTHFVHFFPSQWPAAHLIQFACFPATTTWLPARRHPNRSPILTEFKFNFLAYWRTLKFMSIIRGPIRHRMNSCVTAENAALPRLAHAQTLHCTIKNTIHSPLGSAPASLICRSSHARLNQYIDFDPFETLLGVRMTTYDHSACFLYLPFGK
jgi:hypothetical protein